MFVTILIWICALIATPIIILLVLIQLKKDFWKKRGFPSVSSSEAGGNVLVNMIKGTHVTEIDKQFYSAIKKRNLKFAGFMEMTNPAVFITDLDLLRSIYVKDFDHFVDRRDLSANKLDAYTGKMLFFMEGEPWKSLRAKMSPTFTTGKIKRMFTIIDNCGESLMGFLKDEVTKSPSINMAEGYGKYTVDVIANAAFGIESGAFREKKSVFEKRVEQLQVNFSVKVILKFLLITVAPRIATFLKLGLFDKDACHFFSSTIANVIRHREASGEKRDDFLQLMLEASAEQLKADDELDTFEKEAVVVSKEKFKLTEDIICAQSILFFLAGFETTQTLLQFAGYQLALNPEIQEKLYQEVNDAFTQSDGKFTYESVNEMEYMDKVISETLRMYPPVARLDRRCTKEYTIPGTDHVLPVGTVVAIPSYAIHHDENIFPEPSRFNPERFSKESKGERSPYAFMPFGHGPRNCIGMRFALTESKLALAHLVRNFTIEPCDKTPIPLKYQNPGSMTPKDGMWLNLKPRV